MASKENQQHIAKTYFHASRYGETLGENVTRARGDSGIMYRKHQREAAKAAHGMRIGGIFHIGTAAHNARRIGTHHRCITRAHHQHHLRRLHVGGWHFLASRIIYA